MSDGRRASVELRRDLSDTVTERDQRFERPTIERATRGVGSLLGLRVH